MIMLKNYKTSEREFKVLVWPPATERDLYVPKVERVFPEVISGKEWGTRSGKKKFL